MNYLRANGYKTFIVSGGGVDFMRPWVEQAYGIPPDQVIGSSGKVKYDTLNGKPVLMKLPEINFIDDKEGKPVGIHQYIGSGRYLLRVIRMVIMRCCNRLPQAPVPRFGMIVHHTDAEREWSYDRKSPLVNWKKDWMMRLNTIG